MTSILVVSDSHGTDYSGVSYPSLLEKEGLEISTISGGGLPIEKIYDEVVAVASRFDFVFIQVGNPDVHPRLPKRTKRTLSFIYDRLGRESFYSVPPRLGVKYFAKIPALLFKCFLCRIGKYESYNSSNSCVCKISKMFSEAERLSSNVYVVQLLKVRSLIYGIEHNNAVDKINSSLHEKFGDRFVSLAAIESELYSSCYSPDFFHFNEKGHELIKSILLGVVYQEFFTEYTY